MPETRTRGAPRRALSLFDSTCLIVGIIVGVGIYRASPDIAKGAGGPAGLFALWIAGGLLSLCGALCYAELASAYPREGGDYVYLGRAYGPWAGFLFGWMQMTVVRPGDIAVVAFAFAAYARPLLGSLAPLSGPPGEALLAALAVLLMTAVHIVGVREGKWTQNALTVVKVLGLLAVAAAALAAPAAAHRAPVFDPIPLGVALILVLFTYGGWNEMAYVAAEARDPERNIVRALAAGTGAVLVLYLLINGAFLRALGHAGLAASAAPAADALAAPFPRAGGTFASALVCVSALGAVSGLIFAGARISYAVGVDHKAFRALGRWDERTGTPIRALVVQGGIAIGLIFLLRSFVNTILYTAAPVYAFYLATSLAVPVLRRREPGVPRP
ncbi:MAG: APC family permease, partial [Candidatus Eisenbacteria bacterium]